MLTTINNSDFIKSLILDYFHSILPSSSANIPDLVVKIYSLAFLKSNYLPINAISIIYNIPIYLIKSFISCNIINKYSYNGYTLISTIEIEKAIIHFQSQLSKLENNNNPYFYYYLPNSD
jgi:hypothetical protein